MSKKPPKIVPFEPEFLMRGDVWSNRGWRNFLIVCPNLFPQVDIGTNMAWLSLSAAQSVGAFLVINCQKYRHPDAGDPLPQELRISDLSPSDKRYEKVVQRRNRLLKETGGIPVDLTSYSSASIAGSDYLEYIRFIANEIGAHATPLVFFFEGMDDATADALDLDVAVGAGRVLTDEDTGSHIGLTASVEFVDELVNAMRQGSPDLRIREGVAGYALETGDEIAWWLKRTWNDQAEPLSQDSWRSPEINCVLLTFRCLGLRNITQMIGPLVFGLTEAFKGLRDSKELGTVDWDEFEGRFSAVTSAVRDKVVGKNEPEAGLVREALDFINEKANETVYKGSIEIGDYILGKFFDGDIERANSKKPTKRTSYIALCRHKELVVHPTTLGVMVRVAAQEKFFEAKKLPTEKLSYSHKAELVRIPNDDQKVDLFKETVEKALSVRGLEDRVKHIRAGLVSHERSVAPGSRKRAFDPDLLLKNPIFSNEAELRSMNPERRKVILNEITETLDRLSNYVAQYNRLRQLLEGTADDVVEEP